MKSNNEFHLSSKLADPAIVVADYISFATIFYALHQKSSLIHSVAPPPQIEPASLGLIMYNKLRKLKIA